MLSYAIKRVLGAIPTLFIIITLSFFMMRLAPGGPFDSDRVMPPEIARNIAAAYDLDKPVYQQYLIYLVCRLLLEKKKHRRRPDLHEQTANVTRGEVAVDVPRSAHYPQVYVTAI